MSLLYSGAPYIAFIVPTLTNSYNMFHQFTEACLKDRLAPILASSLCPEWESFSRRLFKAQNPNSYYENYYIEYYYFSR